MVIGSDELKPECDTSSVYVSPVIRAMAVNEFGVFFERFSKADRRVLADDHLDLTKAISRGLLLE